MDYYTRLTVDCTPDFAEILMAELSQAGFDTFEETATGFDAYCEGDPQGRPAVEEILDRYSSQTSLSVRYSKVEKKNWNEEWERSYHPIDVDGRCLIRASFHPADPTYEYDIVITPKMSFGTGHHQTTWLMVRAQMGIDHKAKTVMDAGCGTAILSIMACKLGAARVLAFDIDEWSVINGNENITVNGCADIEIRQGTISEIQPQGVYDIILANINKNVLLAELKIYSRYLADGGVIVLSGFFGSDIPELLAEASKHGLAAVDQDEREGWSLLKLSRH